MTNPTPRGQVPATYPPPSPTAQADSQPGDKALVAVPRDLIGAACSAIDKKRDGARTLAELRRYTVGDLSAAITSAPQADSVCYDYAKQIAESMWATHYKADAPHWESCDSLMGVLSQISNMMCGLSSAPAGSVTAPAGGAEEVDKALNDYAQACMSRAMGWTRENGDAMPDARAKLYSAISSYARGLFTTSPTPQADSQPAATGRIAELEDALSSCLQLVNQLNEHHIPDGCSRLIRHIKDAAATVSKAQASAPADSVREDAARYRWLFGARTDAQTMSVSETVFKPLPQDEVLSHLQGFYMSKAVVDALVDAARKQGSE